MQTITIDKIIESKFFIFIERAKLLQILVNLFRNANDALLAVKEGQPRIIKIVLLKKENKKNLEIRISDNGIGVLPENITRIFSLGFTTKPDGHGYGLHSSALAAKELAGNLRAESKGKNRGATFILTLPLRAKTPRRLIHK